jgi:glycosyltransferase 2 family protein
MNHTLKLSLLLVASAAILTGVVYLVGFERTWEAVQQAGPLAFLVSAALSAVLLALQAGAWAALNPPIKHRVPFSILLKASTVGMALNIVTPSTYLGGEPGKVLYVGRKTGLPYRELAGTVVLAKYLEALSFVLFFSFCTLVAAVSYSSILFRATNLAAGVSMVALAAALLGFFVVLWLSLSRHWTPLTGLVGLFVHLRIGVRFFSKLRERTREMEAQVSRVFCEEGRAAVRSFALFVLTHIVIFVRPAFFFLLGSRDSRILFGIGDLSLIFVTCQALLAFQFTPSGAGTLDAGMIGTFLLVGIAEPQCMAYLLCIRMWDAVLIGGGAIFGAEVGAGFLASKAAPAPAAAADPSEKPRP